MDKLLKIIKTKSEDFENNIENYINSGNFIIDFCKMPFEIKHLNVNRKEKQELENIINRIKEIQSKLTDVLKK